MRRSLIISAHMVLLTALNGTILSQVLLAHDGQEGHTHAKVRKVENVELYAPTPMPDRIVLTWAGDPTNSQSVTWRTSVEVDKAYAEIAIATPGPEFAKSSIRVEAESIALKTDLSTAHYHSAEFKGLTPGTKYAYRVGDGINWSEWFQFSTSKVEQEPFSFIYFGDAQNDIRSMWSRVIREAYSDAPKAKFLLHAGDLINTAQSDAEWGEWFGAGAWLNATIPNVPVVGNHEMHKGPEDTRTVTHHWRPQFALPTHGPQGIEETCYTFVYQNARFVVLNSNMRLQEQAEWLDKTLAANTSRWVVCSFHHPIFSTAKDRDNAQLRALWKPILDKYNVDLVLQGHDHTYGRTGLETPHVETVGNVPIGVTHQDKHIGTVYVVSVSGPKMYNIDQKPFMVRVAEDTQLYQLIHIDRDKLRYESRTANGELYDAFELSKVDGKPNELLEIAPEIQERRRSDAKTPVPGLPVPSGVPATAVPLGK
ncbi:MAG: fibronectin type III domain-containing protein [Planctomycetota bacterium]|jgi:3',5'-cyclic AMP phosphodiesterase CpdA